MTKLISISDHSDYLENTEMCSQTKWIKHRKRVELGKCHLSLGQFIPCDLENNVLTQPEWWHRYINGASPFMNMDEIRPCQEFKEAKERVIFEGFELKELDKEENFCTISNGNIELIFDIENKQEPIIVNYSNFTDYLTRVEDFTINNFFFESESDYNLTLTEQATKNLGIWE